MKLNQLLLFLGAISLIVATVPTLANAAQIPADEKLSQTSTTNSHIQTAPGQAAALVTQPAMINSAADNTIDQANRLKQIANSIEAVHASQSIKPSDFFKNPSASLKQFFQEHQNQTPQPINPLGVSKTEKLDSENIGSINVLVTHF